MCMCLAEEHVCCACLRAAAPWPRTRWDGVGQDRMGWDAELGLPLVPAWQLCLFSPLPEDAPF